MLCHVQHNISCRAKSSSQNFAAETQWPYKETPNYTTMWFKRWTYCKAFSDHKFDAIEGPCICLAYFEDAFKWDPSIVVHAHILLEHLYNIYQVDGCALNVTAPEVASMAISIFLDDIQNLTPTQQRIAVTQMRLFSVAHTHASTVMCLNGGR